MRTSASRICVNEMQPFPLELMVDHCYCRFLGVKRRRGAGQFSVVYIFEGNIAGASVGGSVVGGAIIVDGADVVGVMLRSTFSRSELMSVEHKD